MDWGSLESSTEAQLQEPVKNNQGCTLHCDNKRRFADRLVVLPNCSILSWSIWAVEKSKGSILRF